MYFHKTINNTNKSMAQELMEDETNEWTKKLKKKLDKYQLTESELIGISKRQLKSKLNKKIEDITSNHIKEKAELKSKVKHIVDNKD